MKFHDLRLWLIQNDQEDQWYLSINREVYDVLYDLSEIEEICKDFQRDDVKVLHKTQVIISGKTSWIDIEPYTQSRALKFTPGSHEKNRTSESSRVEFFASFFFIAILVFASLILGAFVLYQRSELHSKEKDLVETRNKYRSEKRKIELLEEEKNSLGDYIAALKGAIAEDRKSLKSQIDLLSAAYLEIEEQNRQLKELNEDLVADSQNRSLIITSLREEIARVKESSNESVALIELEKERIRLAELKNKINQNIADTLMLRQMSDAIKSRKQQVSNNDDLMELLNFDPTQYEIDQLKRRLDDVEFERQQKEHEDAVWRNSGYPLSPE